MLDIYRLYHYALILFSSVQEFVPLGQLLSIQAFSNWDRLLDLVKHRSIVFGTVYCYLMIDTLDGGKSYSPIASSELQAVCVSCFNTELLK